MNSKLIKEELFNRKYHPISYSIRSRKESTGRRVLQSSSGIFYISMIAIIFICLGVFFNIGIKIQTINCEKKTFEINKLILLEKERSDRLQLKISGLKSPARILSKAESELGMKISDSIKIMRITGVNLLNNSETKYLIEKNPGSELKKYDIFLEKIYGLEDIVMVVSEGILTFFIP